MMERRVSQGGQRAVPREGVPASVTEVPGQAGMPSLDAAPRRARALSRLRSRLRESGRLAALLPPLAWMLVFFLAPLALLVRYSFMRVRGFALVPTWTWANYEKVATGSLFVSSYALSWKISTLSALFSLLLAYPLAYIIAFRVSRRWQLPVLLLTIVPFWTSYVVRTYAWQNVLADNGLLAVVLRWLGLEVPSLLYTETAVIVGFVHFFLMLMTLTIYASLVQINPDYIKAAADLGAGWRQTFVHVIWPLSRPGVVSGLVLTVVLSFGDYVIPQVLGGGKRLVFAQVIVEQIQQRVDLPMAAALGVVLMATLVVVFGVSQRLVKEHGN